MRTVVVYESMYGNTHKIADAIGEGLALGADVAVIPVSEAGQQRLCDVDLIVVGGPTHARGMSRPATRHSAIDAARKPGSGLTPDLAAHGPGVREWLAGLGWLNGAAAAFDTRMNGPAVITGRASKGISSQFSRHGLTVVAEPESFLVTKANQLYPGEADRARAWGASLVANLMPEPAGTAGGGVR